MKSDLLLNFAQVSVYFYQLVKNTRRWLILKKTEKVCWERWILPVNFSSISCSPIASNIDDHIELSCLKDDRGRLSDELRERIMWISQTVAENQKHVPQIESKHIAVPFPFEVNFPQVRNSTKKIRQNLYFLDRYFDFR